MIQSYAINYISLEQFARKFTHINTAEWVAAENSEWYDSQTEKAKNGKQFRNVHGESVVVEPDTKVQKSRRS